MEMFSARFKQDVQKLFDAPHTTVVATIPIRKGKPIPLVEDIRFRTDVQLFTVSYRRDFRLFILFFAVGQQKKKKKKMLQYKYHSLNKSLSATISVCVVIITILNHLSLSFQISRENRDEILTAITEAVLKSHTKLNI